MGSVRPCGQNFLPQEKTATCSGLRRDPAVSDPAPRGRRTQQFSFWPLSLLLLLLLPPTAKWDVLEQEQA